MPRLSDDELARAPEQLPGWDVAQGGLERVFPFYTFGDAIAFVNRVADLAEDASHYPQIFIAGPTVSLRLFTEEEGGVTERDVYLARRINALRG